MKYNEKIEKIKEWEDATENSPVKKIENPNLATDKEIEQVINEENEKDSSINKDKQDMINPSHYKSYMGHDLQLQWLEAMQYLPHFQDPDRFKAAVEMQIRKYLDRCGGKDNELQELKKALWYLEFLTAYVANGNKPIRVDRVREILNAK